MKTNRHQPIPGSKPQNRPLPNWISPRFRSYARQSVETAGRLPLFCSYARQSVETAHPIHRLATVATKSSYARQSVENARRPPSGEGSYEEPAAVRCLTILLLLGFFLGGLPVAAQPPQSPAADLPGGPAPAQTAAEAPALRLRQQAAAALIERTVVTLASGPAFDAKLTQHVRTPDHTAVGVGRYEQAGGNTGRVHMDMDISISKNQKCQLLQKCDGRLAWTREQVGDTVRLRRVDVGRLDEMVAAQFSGISPRLRVGGLIELLERAHADFELEQVPAELEGRPVWMLKGSLRPSSQAEILRRAEREDWPPLCPNAIAIAIAADENENGFGKGLPVRFEYWIDTEPEDQAENEDEDEQPVGKTRRLISYLKIYDLQPIQPAPETHFRLETGESDVNYTNDTQRYLDHFGIQVTEKQQRLLTR